MLCNRLRRLRERRLPHFRLMSTVIGICPSCQEATLTFSYWNATFWEPEDHDMNQTCECELTEEQLKQAEELAWAEENAQVEAEAEDYARYLAESEACE